MQETPPSGLTRALSYPRLGLLAALLPVFLGSPSLFTRWYLDDLVHRGQFLDVAPLLDSSDMTNRMYDFLSGEREDVLAFKDLGVVPWWADDEIKIRFWRPLSSFTHVIDYALWPDSAFLMHAHSLAWLAGLIVVVAALYRRMLAAPAIAGAAALLYALDDARGMPAAFLANRNAIVAAFFGALSLYLHDRARRERFFPGAALSPLAFLAALLAGESGIGAAPFLLGYAIFLDRRTGFARFVSIAPHAALGILWLAFYRAGGYGTSGSFFYLDPVGEPALWFREFLVRAPLLLLGQWFVPPSSLSFFYSEAQTLAVAAFGAVVLGLLFFLLRPILREDPTARFFIFGMILAVIPITATLPHDRLLFFVGLGATPLLAILLARLFDRSRTSVPGRAFGFLLLAVHVAVAIPLHLMMSASIASQEPLYANPPRSLPDDPALASQRLVVVNTPVAFYGQYGLLVRLFDGKPMPKSLLMLAPGLTSLTLDRVAADAIEIESERGWLGDPFDIVYRSPGDPILDGYEVELTGAWIDVLESTPDGRPRKVRFSFEVPLEDDSLRWVVYEDGRYVPYALPPVGGKASLAPVEFSLFSP
jgi:hypothetical protein